MQVVLVPQSWSKDGDQLSAMVGARAQLDPTWSSNPGSRGDAVALCCESVDDLAALERFAGIEIVSFTGTGISDVLDMPIVKGRSLTLCNIRDYASVDVAEHTLALILGLAKKIAGGERLVRSGGWSTGEPWGLRLSGKTLGLVGLGAIGCEVARMATALGMNTIYWSRRRHPDIENELGISHTHLEDVFASSDVVSMHLGLNDETKEIVGRRLLGSMKQGSFFVNTARGGLVDGEALLEVLRSGHLGGAGLDVFEKEPLPPDHDFLFMHNVLLSPHVGASTSEAISRARRECLQNVLAYLEGQPRNVVQSGIRGNGA